MKLDPGGSHLWSKRFGSAGTQKPVGVATNAGGSVAVAGELNGSVDFGAGTIESAGNEDVFLVKLGPDGSHVWSDRFGDADRQAPFGLAMDAAGNVVVTGYLKGTVDFGGATLTSDGQEDIFAVKFAPTGVHVWSKRFGDPGSQYYAIPGFDPAGNVVVVGGFADTADFGGGALTSAGEEDIFVAKFGP